ncbi:unnamed protein product [Nippostrongylus brasiliensis]|uniref:MADF domain-containing protein n=1 Tax=Nippostrongylus brasiliensis TaxID=27835 RepID=A0A0N4YB51_NIPBR|nr:unnamed protein product [Nippostrongylus brasiliensis]
MSLRRALSPLHSDAACEEEKVFKRESPEPTFTNGRPVVNNRFSPITRRKLSARSARRVVVDAQQFWTDDMRMTLINEVMACPSLWDVRQPSYRDKQRAAFTWMRVADNVNIAHQTAFNVTSVRKQWKNMKDAFFKKHRSMQGMATDSSAVDLPARWRFMAPMQFLLGTVDTGRRWSNVGGSSASAPSTCSVSDDEVEPQCSTSSSQCRSVDASSLPPRKRPAEPIPLKDAVMVRICDTLEGLQGGRQIDYHDALALKMIDHIDRDVEALLEALLMLLLTDNHRPYVTEAHVPFLETRFRMFDSYLCSMSPSGFYNYLRLYPDDFEALHARLAARLSHLPSHRARLYPDIELHGSAFPTPTPSTWANAVEAFRRQWDYPAAMGALDGKYIACVCPSRSGSTFFNYKGHYSIVLLALVDANYRCIIYDLGASGRSSDAGIFLSSPMKTYLEEHESEFPPPIQVGNVGKGFRLTKRFIRPYPANDADVERAYFNLKLSRFRLLLRPIYASPDNVKSITLAIMILHNLLVDSIGGNAVAERYGICDAHVGDEMDDVEGDVVNDEFGLLTVAYPGANTALLHR